MRPNQLPRDLREACRIHARLLDAFIEMTRSELDRQNCAFVQESLHEMLDNLRADRRYYGVLAGPVAIVENAA